MPSRPHDTPPRDPTGLIAVIGMACRLPGANNLARFWGNLRDGVESLTHFTDEELFASGILPHWVKHPDYVKANAILDDVAGFDADFFDVPPAEAEVMDPQQRIFLECAWEAMESAGYPPLTYPGRVGVYAGQRFSEYLAINQDPVDLVGMTDASPIVTTQRHWANDKDFLATRIAFKLNLTGPAVTVQTACSTSLVAMHFGIRSILSGECDLAIAGGVTVRVPQKAGYLYTEGMIFSPDGKTRSFDSDANGTIFSSGAGAVVLKRLDRALADGDRVRAVILGSAINNDGGGSRKSKYHAPSVAGQAEVVRDAIAAAGVDPATITYVEAHGTATQIGDPIEFNGLVEAFGNVEKNFCAIGSVKSNIGHTVQAAGAVGVIKVALMFENGELVPTLNYKKPNPRIDLENSPFYVNTERRPWPSSGSPRRAGVSSFGVGGTNAHLVLQEPPPQPKPDAAVRYPPLLALSARDATALRDLAARYAAFLDQYPETPLDDLCFTAGAGRTHFDHRLALYAETAADLRPRLAAFAAGGTPSGMFHGAERAGGASTAFLFTGQGSQYPDMGRGLYATEPVFRRAMDECSALLEPWLDRPLLSVLYTDDEFRETSTDVSSASLLNETAYTQPALFAIEYALAQLWISWGVVPDFVLGHSVGEYAAACVAGVFSLADGLKLIAHRGRLMQGLPQDGEMAALTAGAELLGRAISPFGEAVSIAAVNGPESTVISGSREAVRSVCEKLEAEGVQTRVLATSHAFHSHLMDPMLDEFERIAGTIDYAQPAIALISNLTGDVVEAVDAAHWRRHAREAVRFEAGIETLAGLGCKAFIEIGPAPILIGMAQAARQFAAMPTASGSAWLASLRKGQDDRSRIYTSLAALYALGRDVAWDRLAPETPRRRIELPTYPFQRKRYWVEPPARPAPSSVPAAAPVPGAKPGEPVHPLLGVRLESPLEEIQFAAEIRADAPAFLADHVAFDTVTVPATAHIEMAHAAAHHLFGIPGQVTTIRDLIFRRALLLTDGQGLPVRVVVAPGDGAGGDFRIFSRKREYSPPASSPAEDWILHSTGSFLVEEPETGPMTVDLTALQASCAELQPVEDFYRIKDERDLRFGPVFRGVREVRRGDGEALGQVTLPKAASGGPYHVHPALLDACIQIASSAHAGPAGPTDLFLPGAWDRITFHGPVPDTVWSHAVIRGDESLQDEVRTYDLRIYDGDGVLVISIDGLHMKRARRSALFGPAARSETARWLHAIEWQPHPLAPAAGSGSIGRALVFAPEADAAGLAAALEQRGGSPTVVCPAKPGANGAADRLRLDPGDRRGFEELLAGAGPYDHIIYLWGLTPATSPDLTPGGLESALARSVQGLLHLAQAGAAASGKGAPAAGTPAARLWIVTRGAQPAGPQPGPYALDQSPLWGLGRAIASEHPEFAPTLVDLDPAGSPGGDDPGGFQPLFDELAVPNDERQIAFRGAARYAPRLHPFESNPRAGAGLLELPGNRPYRLESRQPGTLDGLALSPALRRMPGPGEIEIEVRATGLNFRDVLVALGRFEDVLGRECSGTVAAVGEGVSDFAAGDLVMAVAPGSFAGHVTIDARHAVRMPPHLTFEQAATIPLAFLTAHYGLHSLAGIKTGDTVLIHAAAGGVGHAAIQIARAAGAEIYATASRGKWAYLRAMGIEHILDSRSLDFAREVLRLTGGRGVDVVLNSLAGDFIPAGLEALAENGRFIEIGATDVWDAERVAAVRPDVAYHWFHLGKTVAAADPDFFRSMFEEIACTFSSGEYRPLPHAGFDITEAARAFRLMSQARHIGKIVVSHRGGEAPAPARIDPEKTYVLTGAFGGLGLKTAAWLVERGARHLALLGRRPPGDDALATLAALGKGGAELRVFQADVADRDSLSAAWAAVREEMPTPDGIFHLAGALDDGVLAGQDWGRFERVLAPKIAGAWNLHRLSEDLPLSHFVLFSSVAGLWGSAGQGNYAAANAFLDALAHYRRACGLPAVSIDWGAWAEVGMAADLGAAVERRRAAAGMGKIDPATGLDLLGQLLGEDRAQAAVIPVDWPQYLKTVSELDRATFFSALRAEPNGQPARSAPASALRSGILQTLASIEPARRGTALVEYLEGQISRIGGIPAGSLDAGRSLAELGIDSLMAVELRNRITADLELQVPMSLFLGNPDIRHLGSFLLEQLDVSREAGPANGVPELPVRAALPADPLLVPLQREGTGRPFFCVHGFGGGVLGYGELARLVGPGRPFIGIRALGIDGEAEPDETVEAMAVRYVEAIRRVQPAGPYDLGGYCLGGVVAFEMARQLRAAGEGVGLVAVIEGHAPGGARERVRLTTRLPAIWRSLPYWFQDYWKLGFKGIRRRVLLKTARWRPRRPETGLPQIAPQDLVDDDISGLPEHHLRIMTLQIRAHRAYITRPFGGKVTVFRARDQSIGKILFGTLDPSLGWGRYADEVEVVEVEGGHRDLHLKPHVPSLAGALGKVLEE